MPARAAGAIDFESTEVQFRFDERGAVEDIVPYERNDAHMLIEECMITANVEAANFLLRQRIAGAVPRTRTAAAGQAGVAGAVSARPRHHACPGRGGRKPRHFEQIVQQVKGRDDQHLVMAVLLRAQSLATYQAANTGHFGLALAAYAHFTSPIRRYPDLLVHRAIHHVLAHRGARGYPLEREQMDKARRAVLAPLAARRGGGA